MLPINRKLEGEKINKKVGLNVRKDIWAWGLCPNSRQPPITKVAASRAPVVGCMSLIRDVRRNLGHG